MPWVVRWLSILLIYTESLRLKINMALQGIILHEAPRLGKPLEIKGVASIIRAETAEEVLEEVQKDPYYINGIWNPSTVRGQRTEHNLLC